jgi:hypothetical protein
MVLPVACALVVLAFLVLTATAPRTIARRGGERSRDQLDESLRSLTGLANPAIPLSFALQAATVGAVDLAQGRTGGPGWLLVAVVLLALALVQQRTLPRTERVLVGLGARSPDPDSEDARHRTRQRRWYAAGLWTLAMAGPSRRSQVSTTSARCSRRAS